jgi:DHA1 family tetracycline resistance protein-like MFS transporter
MRRQAASNFILLTVFLDALSVGVIVPVLPRLLTELGAGGAQAAWAMGALQGGFALSQFLFAALLGAWSDHVGRRPVLLLGLLSLGLSFLAGAWTSQLAVLLGFRMLSGAACANMAVAQAYVADVTPADELPVQYGRMGAVFGLGFILGPVLGGLVGDTHIRWPFFLSAALSGLSFLYGWLWLPESLPPERRRAFKPVWPWSALSQLRSLHGVLPLVWVLAAVMLAQAAVETFWLLYTTFRFDWTPRDNGLSLLVMGLAAGFAQIVVLPWLQKRWSGQRMVQVGLWTFVASLLAWGLASQGWMMLVVAVANVLGYLVYPSAQSLVAAQVPADRQGQTMGALSAMASVMAVLGPMMATPVLAQVMAGSPQAWTAGAPFFSLALVLAAVAWHHQKSQTAAPPA